jgi:hypothetical protein
MILPKGVRVAFVVPKATNSLGRQSASKQDRSSLLVTSYNTVTSTYLFGFLVFPLASRDLGEVFHAVECGRVLSA